MARCHFGHKNNTAITQYYINMSNEYSAINFNPTLEIGGLSVQPVPLLVTL